MATKHTAIINQVLIDWTAQGRGTLWTNPQIRVPMGTDKGWVRAGLGEGTADIVGIEAVQIDITTNRRGGGLTIIDGPGVFVGIEVKCRGDWLKKRQKDFLSIVNDWNANYYLALELPGCTIKKPLYKLYRVRSIEELAGVRREWNKIWRLWESGEIRGVEV